MQNWRQCYLSRRETCDKVSVCGCLSRCGGSHGHDWRSWCGHGHGDWGLGHHGLLVLGHVGGHGHSQGRQVGDGWRRELTEDFHIHCWEAILKQMKQIQRIPFEIFHYYYCQQIQWKAEPNQNAENSLFLCTTKPLKTYWAKDLSLKT